MLNRKAPTSQDDIESIKMAQDAFLERLAGAVAAELRSGVEAVPQETLKIDGRKLLGGGTTDDQVLS